MFALMSQIAKGIITSFSGAIASIPAGWVLCNGSNGTPDLRDNFVIGAGTSYAVDSSGGNIIHGHTASQASHSHDMDTGSDMAGGADYADWTVNVTPVITVVNVATLPPYYALAYIMKL